jgi:hypothetical protein
VSRRKYLPHIGAGLGMVLLLTLLSFANTPGKHTVSLTWTASTTAGVTYNLYRGSSPGVCNGSPTPYASNISGTSYLDTNTPAGTYFYNVSAVGSTGESACDGEVSVTVPNINTGSPSGLAGSVN